MTVYVFKLTTGEDIIGVVENSLLPNDEYYNIIDPMYIVGARDESGSMGMRLRDATLLSEDNMFTIANKYVVTYYKPVPQFANYYLKAAEYARKYTKPMIMNQIEESVKDIERDMAEEEEHAQQIGDILRRITGSTLQ